MRNEHGMNTLTPRQELFVAEYLVDLNAKQAAIRAGYSARTAEQQARKLQLQMLSAQRFRRGLRCWT